MPVAWFFLLLIGVVFRASPARDTIPPSGEWTAPKQYSVITTVFPPLIYKNFSYHLGRSLFGAGHRDSSSAGGAGRS
jgi:hypothetical protein